MTRRQPPAAPTRFLLVVDAVTLRPLSPRLQAALRTDPSGIVARHFKTSTWLDDITSTTRVLGATLDEWRDVAARVNAGYSAPAPVKVAEAVMAAGLSAMRLPPISAP